MKTWAEVQEIFREELRKEFPVSPIPTEVNTDFADALTAAYRAWKRITEGEK